MPAVTQFFTRWLLAIALLVGATPAGLGAFGEASDFAAENNRSAEQENEAAHFARLRQRQPDMRNRYSRPARHRSNFAPNFPQAPLGQLLSSPARSARRLDLPSHYGVLRI